MRNKTTWPHHKHTSSIHTISHVNHVQHVVRARIENYSSCVVSSWLPFRQQTQQQLLLHGRTTSQGFRASLVVDVNKLGELPLSSSASHYCRKAFVHDAPPPGLTHCSGRWVGLGFRGRRSPGRYAAARRLGGEQARTSPMWVFYFEFFEFLHLHSQVGYFRGGRHPKVIPSVTSLAALGAHKVQSHTRVPLQGPALEHRPYSLGVSPSRKNVRCKRHCPK